MRYLRCSVRRLERAAQAGVVERGRLKRRAGERVQQPRRARRRAPRGRGEGLVKDAGERYERSQPVAAAEERGLRRPLRLVMKTVMRDA